MSRILFKNSFNTYLCIVDFHIFKYILLVWVFLLIFRTQIPKCSQMANLNLTTLLFPGQNFFLFEKLEVTHLANMLHFLEIHSSNSLIFPLPKHLCELVYCLNKRWLFFHNCSIRNLCLFCSFQGNQFKESISHFKEN